MAREEGDLYIKYTAGDDGTQVIPAGTTFWASPSIWLTDDNDNGIAHAKVGVENRIYVQVDSTNSEPVSNVKVQVWVCDWTVGFIGPDSVLKSSSSGGAYGMLGRISTAVSKNAAGLTHVKWTPKPADLINGPNPDTGHVCVGANVYREGLPKPDGVPLSGGKLDVINNRHHGWKNITVIAASKQQVNPFMFRLANPGVEPAEFIARAWEVEPGLALGHVEQEHLLMTGFIDLVDGGPEPEPVPSGCLREPRERTRLAQGGQLVLKGMPETTPLRAAEEPADFALISAGAQDQTIGVGIRPGELVPVVIAVNPPGDPGVVHTFDVVQQTQDDLVIGGGRLLVVTVPEWYCC